MGYSVSFQPEASSAFELLSGLAFFEKASHDTIEMFVSASQTRTHSSGTVLFLQEDQADYFYVILSGWVKLFRSTAEGEEAVIDMLTEGGMFGEGSILEEDSHTFGAAVTDEVTLLSFPTSLLKRSLAADSQFALSMLSVMSRHRIRQTKELEGMMIKNAYQRLACFMLRLCKVDEDKDITLKLPYDKSLVAARLGMKPETFSRALNRLRKDTNIEVEGSIVSIPRIEDLTHYACAACSDEFPCEDIE